MKEGQQTEGLLGPLLSNDRLNNATAYSSLTLSCGGEINTVSKVCQTFKITFNLPTEAHMACYWHGISVALNICRQRLETEWERE